MGEPRISVLEDRIILAQLPEGSRNMRVLERIQHPLQPDRARVKYIGPDGKEKEGTFSLEYQNS